jgi:transcriptional antiterminator NusG
MTMADESKKEWYIVQTYSSYENKAKLALEERIAHSGLEEYFDQVFIPTETVTEVRNGKKRQVTRKFYNGYIFVKMHLTDQTWHVVKDTPKIVGFLGNQREPVPVPEEEVRRIEERIEEGKMNTKPTYTFSQGDKVRVIEGNFKDFTGTVEEVNEEKEKLRVFVEIFGRPTSVEFDFEQITTVEE